MGASEVRGAGAARINDAAGVLQVPDVPLRGYRFTDMRAMMHPMMGCSCRGAAQGGQRERECQEPGKHEIENAFHRYINPEARQLCGI